MEEERLDKLLVQRNLVSTRVRAEKIIRESGVKVNGKLITKTGKRFPDDCHIEMVAEEIPWVSRRAYKLLDALNEWKLTIGGGLFMDIGTSEGGFAEVLLAQNASCVFCVDIGGGQLHQLVKDDARIVHLEKTNVRELTPKQITQEVDGCVIDVTSVSLDKIIPFIQGFVKKKGFVIAMVKPQFEVGKEVVVKGGIVKSKIVQQEVIEKIKKIGLLNNLVYVDHIPSPILGEDGNREFLMHLQKK